MTDTLDAAAPPLPDVDRPNTQDGPAVRLYLVDGSGYLFRAYYAIPPLNTADGTPTNATNGFTTMLRKLYQDEKPQWICISFELPGPTFRHERYADYKATRQKMPDELGLQIPRVIELFEAFRIPVTEVPGLEADDVIGTLARKASAGVAPTALNRLAVKAMSESGVDISAHRSKPATSGNRVPTFRCNP